MAPSLTRSDEPLFEKCCRAPGARDGFAGGRVGSAIAHGVINPFYAPAPSEILRVVVSLFIEGTIYNHLEATFVAALVGLVIGLALGIFLGFAAALVPLVADVLEPVMMLLNAIPGSFSRRCSSSGSVSKSHRRSRSPSCSSQF